ncbi:MAG: serine/threonine protein kinase [Anaerolineae bacterium]|nr:serine/threonine protein kinase [Anaerolineae bacterium]
MLEELVGKRLGQYRIKAILGKGAMATVFKAHQPSLDRYVAIKVLPPSFAAENPAFTKRFQREAKAIARLYHPNILPVYDFGIYRDYSYIVMRYVEGARSLSQVIPAALTTEQIIDLISQVASGLAYAHAQGVIHRDVKPSNVLLDAGWALLSDFGLVKVHEVATQITDVGKGIGTPAYMSPEQAQGDAVDQRTDIYSLGVMLYEMLTGTIPHNAPTSLGILLKRTTQAPPSPRAINPLISPGLERVILRSLAIHPADRYESAEDFIAALKKAMTDETSPTPEALNRKTVIFPFPTPTGLAPQEDSLKAKLSHAWRNPFWLTIAGICIAAGALSLSSGNVFRSVASQATPTLTLAPMAMLTPRPTPAPTSTYTPVPTATLTPTKVVLISSTKTPLPATSTPTHTLVLPVGSPPPTITPTATLAGVITLLNPLSLEEPSYGPTYFEWQWTGEAIPPEFGFEVRVWREGEPPTGAHDAVLDNLQDRVEHLGKNTYRLNINIRDAFGVRRRTGRYLWTVALVRISPTYADLERQAEPAYLRFEAGGDGKGDNKDNGSGVGID